MDEQHEPATIDVLVLVQPDDEDAIAGLIAAPRGGLAEERDLARFASWRLRRYVMERPVGKLEPLRHQDPQAHQNRIMPAASAKKTIAI